MLLKKKASLSLRKRKRTEDSLLPIVFDKENQPLEEESLTPCLVSQGDLQEQTGHTRFGSPVKEEVMLKDKLGVVPNNTLQANQWALRNFNLWADTRNNKYDEDPVPSNLLACHDPTIVCKWRTPVMKQNKGMLLYSLLYLTAHLTFITNNLINETPCIVINHLFKAFFC